MEEYGKARQVGIFAICCAVAIRLIAAGYPARIVRFLAGPGITSFQTYLETGRNVRSLFSQSETQIEETEETQPRPVPLPKIVVETVRLPEPTAPETYAFSREDLPWLAVTDTCNCAPDLEALLTRKLNWDLTGAEPAVLILHTHTTESYAKAGENYRETVPYRTEEEAYNMLSIGKRVAELLEAGGIRVIHDRQIHDYPSYNTAYSHARKSIRAYLEEYPSIRLVLDIHRDAAETKRGQMRTLAEINGKPSAQLMLVMGTGNGGQSNAYWLDNLSIGAKLHVLLAKKYTGLMRAMELRQQRFNQDLMPGMLLVEVGAAGNTHTEAIAAAEALAAGILELKQGS